MMIDARFSAQAPERVMGQRNAHNLALSSPRPVERPQVMLYRAIQAAVRAGYQDDGYADEYLILMCRAARGLLSCECGRLDCATMDRYYVDVLRACGEESV